MVNLFRTKNHLKSILGTPTNFIFKQTFKKPYTPFVTELNKRSPY